MTPPPYRLRRFDRLNWTIEVYSPPRPYKDRQSGEEKVSEGKYLTGVTACFYSTLEDACRALASKLVDHHMPEELALLSVAEALVQAKQDVFEMLEHESYLHSQGS